MNGSGSNAFSYLVGTLLDLYIAAVLFRLLLQWGRADFYNPVSQFLVRITNPLLVPLRKVIPSVGKFDTSAILLMLFLQVVSLGLVVLIRGIDVPVLTLLIIAIGELVMLTINVFMFAIIIQVILSWVNPGNYNPVTGLLYSITSPVMRPIQRVMPAVSGIDLSPLVAIIGLQVLRMLIMPLLG